MTLRRIYSLWEMSSRLAARSTSERVAAGQRARNNAEYPRGASLIALGNEALLGVPSRIAGISAKSIPRGPIRNLGERLGEIGEAVADANQSSAINVPQHEARRNIFVPFSQYRRPYMFDMSMALPMTKMTMAVMT